MPEPLTIAVLDDDPDDFILIKDLFHDCYGESLILLYFKTSKEFYEGIDSNDVDLCFVDYRLGSELGTSIISSMVTSHPRIPCILLTGLDDPGVDKEASDAGAYEYLPKQQLDVILLERTIRYVSISSRQRNQLAEERNRFQRVIEESPFPCINYDEDGAFRVASHSFFDMCGLDRQETQSIDEWIQLAYRDDSVDASNFKNQLINDAGKGSSDYSIRHTSGAIMLWRFQTVEIGESIGGDRLFVTSAIDITQLTDALIKAQSANKAKTEFLSVISHELRTPLNPIIGLSELLREEVDDPDSKEMLDTIHSSGEGLLRIVQDLLEFTNTDYESIELNERPFNLVDVINDCVQKLEEEFTSKQLKVRITNIDGEETIEKSNYLGDAERIGQVLTNLLSNAFKFTTEGNIEIQLSSEHHKNSIHKVTISVCDTGIGISSDALENIFEPLYQVDSTYSRKQDGVGLGLSITKSLVERMDGTIEVESELGRGSTFVVSLQLRNEHTSGALEDDAEPSEKIIKHATVLVVEDAKANMLLLRKILVGFGQTVLETFNGQEALECFEENSNDIDLILMDLQMPIMDGFEATTALRARDDSGKTVPIVAITANAGNLAKKLCLEAGMNDYLAKPFSPQDIKDILVNYIATPQE